MLFVIAALLLASPTVAGNKVVIDPRTSYQNLHAPRCEEVITQWRSIKNIKDPEKIGFYVLFLRNDLERCELSPAAVGETEKSLKSYERHFRGNDSFCGLLKGQWKSIKREMKTNAEVGYFVRYLREDLTSCKMSPREVNETENSLQGYERSYNQLVREQTKK